MSLRVKIFWPKMFNPHRAIIGNYIFFMAVNESFIGYEVV